MTIPPITDPLGKHWQQPADIRDAPIDEATVLLTPQQFEILLEYSSSMPTGVYPGKCWKREEQEGWLLGWYGESERGAGWCSNNWRRIEVVA